MQSFKTTCDQVSSVNTKPCALAVYCQQLVLLSHQPLNDNAAALKREFKIFELQKIEDPTDFNSSFFGFIGFPYWSSLLKLSVRKCSRSYDIGSVSIYMFSYPSKINVMSAVGKLP